MPLLHKSICIVPACILKIIINVNLISPKLASKYVVEVLILWLSLSSGRKERQYYRRAPLSLAYVVLEPRVLCMLGKCSINRVTFPPSPTCILKLQVFLQLYAEAGSWRGRGGGSSKTCSSRHLSTEPLSFLQG